MYQDNKIEEEAKKPTSLASHRLDQADRDILSQPRRARQHPKTLISGQGYEIGSGSSPDRKGQEVVPVRKVSNAPQARTANRGALGPDGGEKEALEDLGRLAGDLSFACWLVLNTII